MFISLPRKLAIFRYIQKIKVTIKMLFLSLHMMYIQSYLKSNLYYFLHIYIYTFIYIQIYIYTSVRVHVTHIQPLTQYNSSKLQLRNLPFNLRPLL